MYNPTVQSVVHVSVHVSMHFIYLFIYYICLEVGKMSASNIPIVLQFSHSILPEVERINLKAICCCDKEFVMQEREK